MADDIGSEIIYIAMGVNHSDFINPCCVCVHSIAQDGQVHCVLS